MRVARLVLSLLALSVTLSQFAFAAIEEIPKQRAKQIESAAPAKPRVAPKKARRVLIWVTPEHLMAKDPHKGYNIPYAVQAMKTIGSKTGAFEPVVSQDIASFLPENLKRFDAVVLCNASGPWITPSDEAMASLRQHGEDKTAVEQVLRKSLVDWLKSGGGLMGLHFGMSGNRQWPEFREIVGANYAGHPWNEEVSVTVEEPGHPLLAAFEGKTAFRIADEIFQFTEPYSRDKLRVLLSIDTLGTNMGVRWLDRTDNDFALAWVKSYGLGRVFYTALGHRTELFWDPTLLQFYLDGIQFAAGDLEAPTAPRPDRPKNRVPGPTPPEVRAEKMKAKNIPEPTEEQSAKIREAAPDRAPAKPQKARKALVWGHAWAHQPNPYAEVALKILGEKSGAFQATVTDDPRLLLPDRLTQFDALVMNNIHERDPFLPDDFKTLTPEQQAAAKKFDEAVKQSIVEYVRGGKGLVGIHAATAAFQNWPEYGEMIGGYYGGHIFQEVPIKVEEPKHPINAVLDAGPWRINDEIYISREPYSRDKLRVLLSLDLSQMDDPAKRPDKDYAVAWVRKHGDGRVYYTTLGHAAETYWNPQFLKHLLAGIQFAIGDLSGEAAPVGK